MSPDEFWRQTARTFVAIMDARAEAESAEFERALFLAWHVAAFNGAGRAGKLKKLSHYLPKKPARAQTPDEMLDLFLQLQSRGVPMNIKQVN